MSDKTKSPAPDSSEQSVPFFARFLEGQDTSTNAVQTLKYPSDRDEIDWFLSSNKGQQQ